MSAIAEKIKHFFIRFFYGSKLSLLSLQAFFHYKKLMLIPLLAAIGLALVFGAIFGFIFMLHGYMLQSENAKYVIGVPMTILLFFCIAFLKTFFAVVGASMTGQYCQNNQASLTHAIVEGFKKLRLITAWSTLAAVIRISSGKGKDGKSNSLFGFVANMSWSYLSFFIYPVIAYENNTFMDSLKRSANLMKTYFGATSGSIFTFSALYKVSLIVLLGYAYLMRFIFNNLLLVVKHLSFLPDITITYFLIFVFIPCFCIGFWFILEVAFTAQVAVSTILYRYVNNQLTGIFNRATLEDAVKAR